jgi:hypothetical protein
MYNQFPQDVISDTQNKAIPYRIELVVRLNVGVELVHLPPFLEPIDIA